MRLAALILAMLAASLAFAQEPPRSQTSKTRTAAKTWSKEPDSYRGLKWGASIAEATSARVLPEPTEMNPVGSGCPWEIFQEEKVCLTSFVVSNIWIHDSLHFVHDGLAYVSMSFASENYETVRDLFIERYGPPTTRTTGAVQNRMGAQFRQETLRWRGKSASVSIDRYGTDLDSGFAQVSTASYDAFKASKAKAEKATGAKVF